MHSEKDNIAHLENSIFLAFVSDVLMRGILDAAQR